MSKPAWTINPDQTKKSRNPIPMYEIGTLVQVVDGLDRPELSKAVGVIASLDKAGRPVLAVQYKGEPVIVNGKDVLWKRIDEEAMASILLWEKPT